MLLYIFSVMCLLLLTPFNIFSSNLNTWLKETDKLHVPDTHTVSSTERGIKVIKEELKLRSRKHVQHKNKKLGGVQRRQKKCT